MYLIYSRAKDNCCVLAIFESCGDGLNVALFVAIYIKYWQKIFYEHTSSQLSFIIAFVSSCRLAKTMCYRGILS